jgi:DNA-binding IclR family transcriptional regulator
MTDEPIADGEGAVRTRQPIGRALTLLSWMVDSPDGQWGVRDLARGSFLPVTTVHRLLAALQEAGFVAFDASSGRYVLGIEFLRVALKSTGKLTIAQAAGPYLGGLSRAFDETAFLSVYDPSRREAMFVAAVESTHPLRYVVRLYDWMSVRLGASGLAILAFLPADERREILTAPGGAEGEPVLPGFEQELAAIRARGYARTDGQRVPGAVGIAAPIFSQGGHVVGDVGLSIPAGRFAERDEAELARAVIDCGTRITHELGGLVAGATTRRRAAGE